MNMRNIFIGSACAMLGALALYVCWNPDVVHAPTPTTTKAVEHAENNSLSGKSAPFAPSVMPVPQTTYTITAPIAGTVESVMLAERSLQAVTFETRNYPTLGSFLESINGLRNGNGMYWMLYINNTRSSVGMSGATVVPGDRIEWRYE